MVDTCVEIPGQNSESERSKVFFYGEYVLVCVIQWSAKNKTQRTHISCELSHLKALCSRNILYLQ